MAAFVKLLFFHQAHRAAAVVRNMVMPLYISSSLKGRGFLPLIVRNWLSKAANRTSVREMVPTDILFIWGHPFEKKREDGLNALPEEIYSSSRIRSNISLSSLTIRSHVIVIVAGSPLLDMLILILDCGVTL